MREAEAVVAEWSSPLPLDQIAAIFKETATANEPSSRFERFAARRNERSRQSGFLKHSPTYSDLPNRLTFFTPATGGPFTRFERSPDFAVGASIGHKSGRPHVLHMVVIDSGDKRDIELQSLFVAKFGETTANRRLAARVLTLFTEAFQAAESRVA